MSIPLSTLAVIAQAEGSGGMFAPVTEVLNQASTEMKLAAPSIGILAFCVVGLFLMGSDKSRNWAKEKIIRICLGLALIGGLGAAIVYFILGVVGGMAQAAG